MKIFLLRMVLMGLLGVFGFTAASVYFYRLPGDYVEKTVILAPGTGVRGILNQLHTEGLLPPPWLVALPVLARGEYPSLKAGEYHFIGGLTPAQILRQIARGQVVVHKLTIPEGWNVMQVRAAFMAEPLLSGELPATIAEGSVFPDTVQFNRGEERAAVLARLQRQRQVQLATAWEQRGDIAPITTPEQALILASVVERETGVADERALIAGVFMNRLRRGMKLQSDPTVVYGIEAQSGRPLGRELTSADLKADTLYNSYTREGLPPTPICNPGQAAIEAVMHPAATDALFFVATGHGGHRFSATMENHEANVVEYRKAIGKPVKKPAAAPSPKKRAARKR
ncbi:MAG: endolytic transglycosylase MltG [Rickettsiales bacterium]